jgi:hypothetical protein
MNDAIVMLEGPDQRAAEISAFKSEFLRYASQPDLSQPCPIGRLVTWELHGGPRREAIWETVNDAIADKPDFMRRAVEFICAQARFNPEANAARELLSDMAEHWAELRCDL